MDRVNIVLKLILNGTIVFLVMTSLFGCFRSIISFKRAKKDQYSGLLKLLWQHPAEPVTNISLNNDQLLMS